MSIGQRAKAPDSGGASEWHLARTAWRKTVSPSAASMCSETGCPSRSCAGDSASIGTAAYPRLPKVGAVELDHVAAKPPEAARSVFRLRPARLPLRQRYPGAKPSSNPYSAPGSPFPGFRKPRGTFLGPAGPGIGDRGTVFYGLLNSFYEYSFSSPV